MIKRHDRSVPGAVAMIGHGAHAADLTAIYKRVHPNLGLAYYDDDVAKQFGQVKAVEQWDGRPFYIGVNDPQARQVLDMRLDPDRAADPLVDPSVVVGFKCELRPGCVLAPGVVLLADVKLGNHVHVNYGSSLTRAVVGAYTTIAPGVTVCGDVTIGQRVFIGAGSVIRNGVSIGDDAFIRMGSNVICDVDPEERV